MQKHPRLPHRIFAYGTLKTGEPNHGYLSGRCPVGRAQLVGRAVTDRPYPLIIATHWNLPFLLYAPDQGQRVLGEVYEVDDDLLAWMDAFEGHPEVYQRDHISVSLADPPPRPHPTNDIELCRESFNNVLIDDPPANHATTLSTGVENEMRRLQTTSDELDRAKGHDASMKNMRSESASTGKHREACPSIELDGGRNGVDGGQNQQDSSIPRPPPPFQEPQQKIDCWCYFLKKFPAGLLALENYADYKSRGAHNKHYFPDNDLSGPDTIEEALEVDCRR